VGADVVFDAAAASGIPPILTSLVRSGGTVLVAGVYHEHGAVDLPDVVYREISLVGTRACTHGDMRGAIDLLVRRPAEFDVLAGDVVGPERMGDAVARLGRGETMKVLVDCEPFRR
jgi:threonine dehydrogenase-like Zn-dependent dehydrogenase